jgi:transcription elongation factor GreA
MAEVTYLTQEGLSKLKAELHDLKTKQRASIANAIAEAREKGDLSENAEYDAAKEAQSLLELKISQLESLLSNARLVDDASIDTSKVFILSFVQVKNKKTNAIVTYQIVSEKEANVKENKLSVESPIGKGLLGKKVGDVVQISVPAGLMEFEILAINR